MGEYPPEWIDGTIPKQVKDEAGWKCIRCNHPHHVASWHVLTVHHLDGIKSNVNWWNLAALCQRCHLHIQAKVKMERIWMFDHSEWFKPYVAGYYAYHHHLDHSKEFVLPRMDELIMLGQGKIQQISKPSE